MCVPLTDTGCFEAASPTAASPAVILSAIALATARYSSGSVIGRPSAVSVRIPRGVGLDPDCDDALAFRRSLGDQSNA